MKLSAENAAWVEETWKKLQEKISAEADRVGRPHSVHPGKRQIQRLLHARKNQRLDQRFLGRHDVADVPCNRRQEVS